MEDGRGVDMDAPNQGFLNAELARTDSLLPVEGCPMQPVLDDIQRVTDALVREFHPTQVILFGSRVYGNPRPDSDVDLLVVMPFAGSLIALMSAMLASAYRVMEHRFAVDFHTRNPLAAGAVPNSVMRDAIEKGVIVYVKAA